MSEKAEPLCDRISRIAEQLENSATDLRGLPGVSRLRAALPDAVAALRHIAEQVLEQDVELAELRERIGEPETVWGHQVHSTAGWVGDAVSQGSEAAARAAMEHMNTQVLNTSARAKLVVHEVWHAETEWRVADEEKAVDGKAEPNQPIRPPGLMTTLQRVSGLNSDELGRLFSVSANAIRAWQCGARMNQAHYDRAVDLNERMQQLPSRTFYNRRAALMDTSSGQSVYDQMLAERYTPPIDGPDQIAYFEAGGADDA